MTLVEINAVSRERILAAQALWGLTDTEMATALFGRTEDGAKIIRAYKSGHSEPTETIKRSFLYLESLVRIVNNSPLDAEDNYAIAHAALPLALQ